MRRGLHLTPTLLVASYELCLLTTPIRGWRLPHADTIHFNVLTARDRFGHFKAGINGGLHELSFSSSTIGSLDMLNRTMLHEICHLRAFLTEGSTSHGAAWKRARNAVCLAHHLDPKAF